PVQRLVTEAIRVGIASNTRFNLRHYSSRSTCSTYFSSPLTRRPCRRLPELLERAFSAGFVDGGGKRAKTAVVWLLFTLPLSLLEGGVLSERPAAVKGAPALRGEANPSRRGPF